MHFKDIFLEDLRMKWSQLAFSEWMKPTWFFLLKNLSWITESLNWQHALALNALNGNCSWWFSWTETALGAKYQLLLCYDAVLGGWCNFFNSCFRFCAALSSLLLLCFFTQPSTSWNTCFFNKYLPDCIALHLRTLENLNQTFKMITSRILCFFQ